MNKSIFKRQFAKTVIIQCGIVCVFFAASIIYSNILITLPGLIGCIFLFISVKTLLRKEHIKLKEGQIELWANNNIQYSINLNTIERSSWDYYENQYKTIYFNLFENFKNKRGEGVYLNKGEVRIYLNGIDMASLFGAMRYNCTCVPFGFISLEDKPVWIFDKESTLFLGKKAKLIFENSELCFHENPHSSEGKIFLFDADQSRLVSSCYADADFLNKGYKLRVYVKHDELLLTDVARKTTTVKFNSINRAIINVLGVDLAVTKY